MRSIAFTAASLVLMAANSRAESELRFELLLGGDNHVENWEGSVNSATWVYTGGVSDDGYVSDAYDGPLNWAVTVEVIGVPDDCTNPQGCRGLARVAFDLELHEGTADGPLVSIGPGSPTDCGWFSTINDGDDDGPAGAVRGADPLAPAAFATAFDAKRTPINNGIRRGRLIDTVPADGPWMQDYGYPVADAGTMTGMFAGYTQYNASGCPTGLLCSLATAAQNAGGVGNITDTIGLGNGPIAEGQINMGTCASAGFYTLKLIARRDENLLLGDFDPATESPVAFTHPVVERISNSTDGGATGGDTISFHYVNFPPPPVDAKLLSAVSRRTHPSQVPVVGDIDLGIDTGVGIEPREGGPTNVVLTFDYPIQSEVGPMINCANVQLSAGTCSVVSGSGTSEIEIYVSGLPDGRCTTLRLVNVTPIESGVVKPAVVRIGTLRGDVNGDGIVNIVDLNKVKQSLFQGGANPLPFFRRDVNVDGVINIIDLGEVKSNLFATLNACE